jgi:site-specific DNA recombinase
MRAATYARVSTDRQGKEQTIDSQLVALQEWAACNGHELLPHHVYQDEGYSGSRLDRPALDRLRDAAHEGDFDLVAVFSPDRLARKYAYQVLLLEELRKAGCEVVFLQHPISDDPHDQLLLQIQGAVAEYERAVLGERFRRGKLQKAREGHWIGGKAPYGYRYVPRRDEILGHLVIDEIEAELVRHMYRWLVDERLTIRQILKRLNGGPWRPRSGCKMWSASVVHHVLSDPVYMGIAYANRYRFVPPKQPRSRGPRSGENTCRQPRPSAEWIPIPVPAIVDADTHRRAEDQLARNAMLSFRHNQRYTYLLRCLLTCRTCGLAMHGVTHQATARQDERRYYKCRGKDCIASGRLQPCPQRMAKVAQLDAQVWDHMKQLLSDPERLLDRFESFGRLAVEAEAGNQTEAQKLDAQLRRLQREESRLIDAYQAEVIDLKELGERRLRLSERRRALVEQQQQQMRLQQEAAKAQLVLADLTAFCERVRTRLDLATFEEKQALLQLLVERIVVGDDTLEIHHVIPLRGLPPGDSPGNNGLRSDGVHPAALLTRRGIDLPQGFPKPQSSIPDRQLRRSD